jgi:hypothetical protein
MVVWDIWCAILRQVQEDIALNFLIVMLLIAETEPAMDQKHHLRALVIAVVSPGAEMESVMEVKLQPRVRLIVKQLRPQLRHVLLIAVVKNVAIILDVAPHIV